jgi:hypothetical protein
MEFLYYFDDVFTLWAFGMLLLGTVFGLILGATPGLSPTMAVALAIPFTFKMEPAHGLILLGALYTSTVAGWRSQCHFAENSGRASQYCHHIGWPYDGAQWGWQTRLAIVIFGLALWRCRRGAPADLRHTDPRQMGLGLRPE